MIPTLLIAGHGYLGQAVSEQCRELNFPVATLSKSGEQADLACDLTDPAAIQALATDIQPTHILLCASSGRGGTEAYRNIFLNGTQNLLHHFPHSHLTFISSTSVYRQTDGSTVDEESDTHGTTEKSAILLEGEQLTLTAGGTALRLSGIYGPDRSVILRKFLADEGTLEDTGSDQLGIRILNQIHRDDAARAILHLITKQLTGLYNVTDNEPTSQLETYQQLCEKLSKPLPPVAPPNPNSKRGWTHKAVSNKKLLATGWSPHYPNFPSALDDLLPS